MFACQAGVAGHHEPHSTCCHDCLDQHQRRQLERGGQLESQPDARRQRHRRHHQQRDLHCDPRRERHRWRSDTGRSQRDANSDEQREHHDPDQRQHRQNQWQFESGRRYFEWQWAADRERRAQLDGGFDFRRADGRQQRGGERERERHQDTLRAGDQCQRRHDQLEWHRLSAPLQQRWKPLQRGDPQPGGRALRCPERPVLGFGLRLRVLQQRGHAAQISRQRHHDLQRQCDQHRHGECADGHARLQQRWQF